MVCIMKIVQAVIAALLILTTAISVTSLPQEKSIETTTEVKPPPECQTNTPCGWAVYTPFTRKVDYWMKNTCECASNMECVKIDDDLSVSAYVYRCRSLPKTGDTNSSSTHD